MARQRPTGLPAPRVEDATLQQWIQGVGDRFSNLETDVLNALKKLGFLNREGQIVAGGIRSGTDLGPGTGGTGGGTGELPPLGVPTEAVAPKPSGFTADAGIGIVVLFWDNSFMHYANHAITRVYRHTTNDFNNASEIGTSTGISYVDEDISETEAQTFYYWIRWETTAGSSGLGPPSDSVEVETSPDPAIVIEALEEEILGEDLTKFLLDPGAGPLDFLKLAGISNTIAEKYAAARQLIANSISEKIEAGVTTLKGTVEDQGTTISTLETTVEAQGASITENATAISEAEADIATHTTEIAAVRGTANTNEASIQINATAIATNTAALARWTVKTTVNGLVGGIGLLNDGTTTRFTVLASRFAILQSTDDDPEDVTVPFAVVGGKTYIKDALIADAAISVAKVKDAFLTNMTAAKGKLAAARIDVANIFDLSIGDKIQSENYNAGTGVGWKMTKGGVLDLFGANIRGTIRSASFVAGSSGWIFRNDGTGELDAALIRGTLTADHIDSDVRNARTLYQSSGDGVLIGRGWRAVTLNDDVRNWDAILVSGLGDDRSGWGSASREVATDLIPLGTQSASGSVGWYTSGANNNVLGATALQVNVLGSRNAADDVNLYVRRSSTGTTLYFYEYNSNFRLRSIIGFNAPGGSLNPTPTPTHTIPGSNTPTYTNTFTPTHTFPAPGTPTGLSVNETNAVGGRRYVASWNSVVGADEYEWQFSGSNTIHSTDTTSINVVNPLALRGIRVRAKKSGVAGPWTSYVYDATPAATPTFTNTHTPTNTHTHTHTHTLPPAPPTPTGLTVNETRFVTQRRYAISWNASAGATSYDWQFRNGTIHNTANTSVTASSSVAFREVRVRAKNAGGTSAWSAYVDDATPDPTRTNTQTHTHTVAPVTVPGAPGRPSASNRQQTSIDFQWAVPSTGGTPTYYRLYYSTNSVVSEADPYITVLTRQAKLSGLNSGTNYWVAVKAGNSAGRGPFSATRATSTTSPATATNTHTHTTSSLPSPVSGLTVTEGPHWLGGRTYSLSWNLASGATSYDYAFSSGTIYNTDFTSGTLNSQSSGLQVRVRSRNSNGVSAWRYATP